MAEWLRKIKRNRLGYGARLASVDGAPLAAQVTTENDKATDCKLQVTSVNSEKQKHKRLFGKCTRHFDGSKVGILTDVQIDRQETSVLPLAEGNGFVFFSPLLWNVSLMIVLA
jgi:hypothetical protein